VAEVRDTPAKPSSSRSARAGARSASSASRNQPPVAATAARTWASRGGWAMAIPVAAVGPRGGTATTVRRPGAASARACPSPATPGIPTRAPLPESRSPRERLILPAAREPTRRRGSSLRDETTVGRRGWRTTCPPSPPFPAPPRTRRGGPPPREPTRPDRRSSPLPPAPCRPGRTRKPPSQVGIRTRLPPVRRCRCYRPPPARHRARPPGSA
jgi:hypothetical protein